MRRRGRKDAPRLIVLSGLSVAVFSLAYALSSGVPLHVTRSAEQSLAAVSVSIEAAVPQNPDNTLAAQLAQKQQDLNAQQAVLQKQETTFSAAQSSSSDLLGAFSLAASLVLFLLVGLNFYFDRRRSSAPGLLRRALTVDLRASR